MITNIEPSEDVELKSRRRTNSKLQCTSWRRRILSIRLLLPFENTTETIGIPMEEVEEGLYVGTWNVPEGIAATDLQVQVVYVDEYGYEIYAIAEGRVTIIANIAYLANNTIIIGDEAFDLEETDND